jgi:hypothetical protein
VTAAAKMWPIPDDAPDLSPSTVMSGSATSDVVLVEVSAPVDSAPVAPTTSGWTTVRHRRLHRQWRGVTAQCRAELMADPEGELRPELVQVLLRTGMATAWADWIMTGPDSETWRLSNLAREFIQRNDPDIDDGVNIG